MSQNSLITLAADSSMERFLFSHQCASLVANDLVDMAYFVVNLMILMFLLLVGDQVMEWDGSNLEDTTFDESRQVISRSGHTVQLVVMHTRYNNEYERAVDIHTHI